MVANLLNDRPSANREVVKVSTTYGAIILPAKMPPYDITKER
jgi:hypothetical protein